VKEKKGDVEILHTPNNDEPEANLTSHKHYDVEAFRLLFDEPFMGKGKQVYSIRYYMIARNDSLDYRKAWIGTDENYDKLTYNWLNDSTVTVRLYDSITSKGDTFQLFSTNGGSGIRTKEDIISQ
jgi:hypothetical protein